MMPANVLKQQYVLLKGSRDILFAYCETLKPEHLIQDIDYFGRGSIHNLLRHIANTYIHWLANYGMGAALAYTDDKLVLSINDFHHIYQQVDQCVDEFVDHFADNLFTELDNKIPGTNLNVKASPLKLFTHVLTHEYHHKGQILSMSRHLGYTPVDTDVIQ